jgi:Ca2+-binding RTX toxin-like protein
MAGGDGDDLFFVTDPGDVVIERAGGGADTVIASFNMTLPDHVEVLLIAGGISSLNINDGTGNDMAFGHDLANSFIDGTYTIITSISLTTPDHFEALQIVAGVSGITITGGTGNDMLIGNGLSNNFNGGAGDDVILTGNVSLADIYMLFAM